MFVGSFTHNVDTKGRVFVPSKLRQGLGQSFHICRSMDTRCIRIYNNAEWDKVMEKLLESEEVTNEAIRRFSFFSSEVEMDAQGRIMIPEVLRKFARISDKAYIVGMLGWVEIWEPSEFASVMGEDDDLIDVRPDEYGALRKAGIR